MACLGFLIFLFPFVYVVRGEMADLYDFSLKSITCQFILMPYAGVFVRHKHNDVCTHTQHTCPQGLDILRGTPLLPAALSWTTLDTDEPLLLS